MSGNRRLLRAMRLLPFAAAAVEHRPSAPLAVAIQQAVNGVL
jgi:hypothetical protein